MGVKTTSGVVLLLALCVVAFTQVHGGKIVFPDSTEEVQAPSEGIDVNVEGPESRGLWESDLFFLQKLSGLFGGSEGDQRQKPSRKGGLRPEYLPPQLLYPPNRRVGAGHQRPHLGIKPAGPVYRVPIAQVPQQDLVPPQDLLAQPAQNTIAIHLPPPPPPPPSPPPSRITASPVTPISNFPYKFVRPNGITPSISSHIRPPVRAPPRIDVPPQVPRPKPIHTKPVKSKKPSILGSFSQLAEAFSITPKPQINFAVRPQPQVQQQQTQRVSRPTSRPKQEPLRPKPQSVIRPHPRPAPQPQKQHPRPLPQPQRVIMQPEKPNTIQKKPIYPEFKPSPQEGSILADAFQPVFVASPSMEDLNNDIMKPMRLISSRSSITTTTPSPPVLVDFF